MEIEKRIYVSIARKTLKGRGVKKEKAITFAERENKYAKEI